MNINIGIVLVLASLQAGCTASRLDDRGDTHPLASTRLGEPLAFARSVSGISTTARDYVYLGAIEVSNGGVRSYLIWVGLASTLDRGAVGRAFPTASRMRISTDTDTLDFPLTAWDDARSDARFDTSAPVYRNLGVDVTDTDLSRIANAGIVDVTLVDDTGKSLRYTAWGDTQSRWITPADDDVGFSVVLRDAADAQE